MDESSEPSKSYSIFWSTVLCILSIFVVLWHFSIRFRFYMKTALYYVCIILTSIGVMPFCVKKPFDADNYFYVQWGFQALTRPMNIKWELKEGDEVNLEHKDTPFIVVANHQSTVDLMGMMAVWPKRCAGLVKKSLMYAGPFGLSAALSGCVFIDRFNRDKAIECLQKTVDYVKDQNVCLWVFPEGTRNNAAVEGLLPFKKGVFHLAVQAQIPIVPVIFSSFSPFYSPKDYRFNSNGYCIVRALEPISTIGMTSNDVTPLSESTRDVMSKVFTEISIEAADKYASQSF